MTLYRDDSLRAKLRKVSSRLEETGVHWAIFAGAAAHCYGSKRKVTDIDILVRDADLEKAKAAAMGIDGVDVVADLKMNVDGETCLFFMDQEMEQKIRRRKLFDVEVPVVPVEDNVTFKAILQRTEKQGKHDTEDIQCMIKNEKIDMEYLKKRTRKYHAEKRVKPLLKLLGIPLL
jgi:predicted nucleotidyltransferase